MCDCANPEESNQNEDCQTTKDNQDSAQPPIAFLQVELSKADLNLLSGTDSSSTSESAVVLQCLQDATCPELLTCQVVDPEGNLIGDGVCPEMYQCQVVDVEQKPKTVPCPDRDEEDKSSSLKTCTCSGTCPSIESEPTVQLEEEYTGIEGTLAIIKPEAMMYRKEIERTIIDEAFEISQRRWLRLTPEQVSDFYLDNYEEEDFARLVAYMSSGPIIAMILSKVNAVEEWKMLMGPAKVRDARVYAPDSIRGKYGREGDDMQNAVHGSDSRKAAVREIHFFFPDRITEPISINESAVEYLSKEINEILLEGLVKCCESKPDDPVIWLGNWLLDNNNRCPKYLLRYKSNL